MLSAIIKTALIVSAAAVISGATGWLSKYVKEEEEEEEEDDEEVVYDINGKKYKMSDLKGIDLSAVTKQCWGVKRQLDPDFQKLHYKVTQALLINAQLEEVYIAYGPFAYKHGGLPFVHTVLSQFGDVIDRTRWYAKALAAGINRYENAGT